MAKDVLSSNEKEKKTIHRNFSNGINIRTIYKNKAIKNHKQWWSAIDTLQNVQLQKAVKKKKVQNAPDFERRPHQYKSRPPSLPQELR